MSRLLFRGAEAALAGACLLLIALPGSAGAVCRGDCSDDGDAEPAELRRIIDIINLCQGNPQGCPDVQGSDKQCNVADADASGGLTASELARVIKNDVIAMNEECEGGTPLGVRVFTVAQSSGFSPPTGFFSTGNNGGEVTDNNTWYIGQSLNLRAGAVNAQTGIAKVRLENDAIFGGQVIMGGPTLCVKIFAQGSSGEVDCDGGSPQDITLNVDSNGGPSPCPTPNPSGPDPCKASPSVLTPHTGAGSRAGGLTLSVMATVDNISPALTSPAECVNHVFGPPSQFHFTSERATVLLTEIATNTLIRYCSGSPDQLCSLQGGCVGAGAGTCSASEVRLSRLGTPFNCQTWTTTNSGGRLVTPLFGEDADARVGDTANMLLVGDN